VIKILSNIKPFPEYISHKKLKSLLSKAPQGIQTSGENISDYEGQEEELNNYLKKWMNSSQLLIEHLRQDNNNLGAHKNSKSILALGAMEAHINMAIQALKGYESESK